MKDKYGNKLRSGDLIRFDTDFLPGGQPLRVRYERKGRLGWLAEKLAGDPTPQRIGQLGHRFVILNVVEYKS